MILQDFTLTPKRQAHIYAVGMLTIITLGTFAMIGACLAALWALVEVATLLLTSTVEACNAIGQTYASADSLVKFLLLVTIGYMVYQIGRRALRRA